MNEIMKFRMNVYSQNGEDGVLWEIFKRLGINNGKFVEFGAWDGKYLSNSYNLLINGWSGVYIEGDSNKYKTLCENCQRFRDRVTTIEAYVNTEENSLHKLLKRYAPALPLDFDFLSIDIDSFDFQVWKAFEEYNPKVVVIEINSEYGIGAVKVHSSDITPTGTSFTPMLLLGLRKGYKLLCHIGNLVFIRSDLVDKFDISQNPYNLYIPNHGYLFK